MAPSQSGKQRARDPDNKKFLGNPRNCSVIQMCKQIVFILMLFTLMGLLCRFIGLERVNMVLLCLNLAPYVFGASYFLTVHISKLESVKYARRAVNQRFEDWMRDPDIPIITHEEVDVFLDRMFNAIFWSINSSTQPKPLKGLWKRPLGWLQAAIPTIKLEGTRHFKTHNEEVSTQSSESEWDIVDGDRGVESEIDF